jgi:hypothetical protein
MTDAYLFDPWAEAMCHNCYRWIKFDHLIAEIDREVGWLLLLCPYCSLPVIRNKEFGK